MSNELTPKGLPEDDWFNKPEVDRSAEKAIALRQLPAVIDLLSKFSAEQPTDDELRADLEAQNRSALFAHAQMQRNARKNTAEYIKAELESVRQKLQESEGFSAFDGEMVFGIRDDRNNPWQLPTSLELRQPTLPSSIDMVITDELTERINEVGGESGISARVINPIQGAIDPQSKAVLSDHALLISFDTSVAQPAAA